MNFTIFKNLKPPKHIGKSALGLTAAGTIALNMLIIPWEHNVPKPYLDVGGVPTACGGVTGPEITKAYNEGYVFTKTECDHLNARAVRKHELGLRDAIDDQVEKIIPEFTMAAYISWTYNVGTGAAARSTLVRKVNAGDLVGACDQLKRWTRVNGVVVRGLENRRVNGDSVRISERTLCLIGLDPNYKTPLFEKLYFNYQTWVENVSET